LTQCTEDTLRE
jgi:hypothetical protein